MTAILIVLSLSVAAADEVKDKPITPAEQYIALVKDFNQAASLFFNAATDEERTKQVARAIKLAPRLLELVEKNPHDAFVIDALIQVVNQELWLQANTKDPGRANDRTEASALELLLRHHVRSDKLGEACRRVQYGFRKECETFLRTVLEMSPHRDVQALACLRLAQFLHGRLQRLDLIKEQPEMAKRYERLFGKDYLDALLRQDRAKAVKDVEKVFEWADAKYGDVKVPYGGTVAERVKTELYEIRFLSIGKTVQEIEGDDQDGKRFKLSDYRGKVVLLYFWLEY
ncbi:MAG: peroxiredoxin family protein [Gemmataceae bacterium]|nr:peroxiredoxin family protein [Gemmataceae bacterium]